MKKKLAVWTLCVSLLLIPSGVIGDAYTVTPVQAGDCVDSPGNLVSDTYIKAVRECQVEREELRDKVDEAPKEGVKDFTDGVLWGAVGTVLLFLLL